MGVGMVFFVMQDAMMKTLLGPFTVWQLICIRSLLTAFVLIPAIVLLGAPHRLLTPLWPLHLCRAALFAVGFSLFYTAFPFMTLASVTTIFFSAPLITAILAAVVLRETVGPYRTGALIVGFAGVIVAMNPGSDSFQWVSILPLMCATTYSISQIIVRKVGERETTLTVGLYTIVFAGIFVIPMSWSLNAFTDFAAVAPHLRWEWGGVSFSQGGELILLGVFGMIGYLLISRAYQVTDASVVAPFEY
ncbi:MAG: EamA family transporter, partial [Rhodospirillales bacterium]|nr:EamA family transporter [Rhodospirillales bacterium]